MFGYLKNKKRCIDIYYVYQARLTDLLKTNISLRTPPIFQGYVTLVCA